jgi:hypothetical protein
MEHSNQFPRKKKKPVNKWKLVYKIKDVVKEELIIGAYPLCQMQRNKVKYNYPKNSLKIIPVL